MKHFYSFTLLNYILLFFLAFTSRNFTYVLGKSREKRLIIFPKSGSLIQMVLGFGLPFEVDKQSVTIGPFVKSLYLLPTNSSYYTNPSIVDITGEERKKNVASTRWNFYNTLSAAAQYLGYGGKSCVLRTICETSEVPFSEHSDIFTEIFHVIFTPSSTLESVDNSYDNEYYAAEQLGKTTKNCDKLFPECKVNLMDSFTEIYSHFGKNK